jgi:hypothetical protein
MMTPSPPAQMPFPAWVTPIERYWVNSREHRSLGSYTNFIVRSADAKVKKNSGVNLLGSRFQP